MHQKLKENKRFITFIPVFLLTLWPADALLTAHHESVHREICKNFGRENVTTYTNYSYLWTSGRTFCSNLTGRGTELQMRTDIVGYHAEALLYVFFMGIILLVGYRKL